MFLAWLSSSTSLKTHDLNRKESKRGPNGRVVLLKRRRQSLRNSLFQREKYHGSKTTKELVKYALQQVGAVVHELWTGNWRDTIEEDNTDHPWLISFCGDGGGLYGNV
jgi:hypothetical protein